MDKFSSLFLRGYIYMRLVFNVYRFGNGVMLLLFCCSLTGCGVPEAIECAKAIKQLAEDVREEDCRDGDAQEDLDELARDCRKILTAGATNVGSAAAYAEVNKALDSGDSAAAEAHAQDFIRSLIADVIAERIPEDQRYSELQAKDGGLSGASATTELALIIEGGDCPEDLLDACQDAAKIVNRCCGYGVRLTMPGNVESVCAERCLVTFPPAGGC